MMPPASQHAITHRQNWCRFAIKRIEGMWNFLVSVSDAKEQIGL